VRLDGGRSGYDDSTGVTELGLRWCRPINNRAEKEQIAAAVAARCQNGDVIGAGSGSTSFLTVIEIGRLVAANDLALSVVPTSLEIEMACHAVGLRVESMIPTRIDWCFDGADEVDPRGRLIKGRGGAVHREREVFAVAAERVVVADDSKSVERLGSNFAVPVEVDPRMIWVANDGLSRINHVQSVDLRLAMAKDGPVFTETGRVLFDVKLSEIDEEDEGRLLEVPGVCCTGIFSGYTFERVALS
jgi:ribose 5-phosphate isomerase A